MTVFGIIGAGKIGSNVARAVIAQGHSVVLANTRGPESLADLVDVLGPSATAATPEQAAEAAEIAVVAIPFGRYREVPVAPLAGKIVLDANNYYFERDGRFPDLDEGRATTSGLLQQHLPQSRVVKAFNHILATDIPADGRPAGTPDRRALAISGDDPAALSVVAALFDELGYDTVEVTPLSESWRFERDRPAYVKRQNREELIANLAAGTRTI